MLIILRYVPMAERLKGPNSTVCSVLFLTVVHYDLD